MEKDLITIQFVLNIILQLLIIFFPAVIGSYAKDYLDIIHGKIKKIKIGKIIVSSITSTVIVFGFWDVIMEIFGFRALLLASFLSGVVGFQILEKISTIEGIFKILEDFYEFRRNKK